MTEAFSGSQGGPPRSSLDRFMEALDATGLRYTTKGDHLQVECPVHPDNTASLSADYKPSEGSVLFFCQAMCESEDVLAALGLTWPMLHDDYEPPDVFAARRAREREEEHKSGRRTPSKPRKKVVKPERPALPRGKLPDRLTGPKVRPLSGWKVVSAEDYPDAQGVSTQQEVRRQREVEINNPETGQTRTKTEKKFDQRYPDGKGGWLEDGAPKGFVPVLYGLPDVLEWVAEGRTIWLTEGVKDTKRFLELGEAATTNPAGAGNFKPEQAATLAGANVIVVLDHDLAGYRRGLKLSTMLRACASVRLVLPVSAGRHEDASDHFNAGHGLDDFIETSAEELQRMVHVTNTEEAAQAAADAAREATARAERAKSATAEKARETEARYAARWAAEAGKYLVRATGALEDAVQAGPVPQEYQERMRTAVTSCQESARTAHEVAGVEIPEQLEDYLTEPSTQAAEAQGHTVLADLELGQPGSNVVQHPSAPKLPPPAGTFPMSRGRWGYELGGEGRRARGVYMMGDNTWVKVAPLPFLHARIVSRDGYGRPMGHYYLISAEEKSTKVTIGHDELAKHTWPNILGLPMSQDDKILKAATTALIFAAEEVTELVEATPRVTDEGTIAMPVPETLPHGYMQTAPIAREQAIGVWGDIVRQAAESPRMSLVLGASAFSPFLAVLGNRQPHILSLHGEMAQGKSTVMRTAAAMWGWPGSKAEAGVCASWNQSKLAPTAYLGELGVLPAYFDEIGMAGNLSAMDWGKRIYDICEGASRGRPAANGKPGFVRGRSWYGILFSAGNSRLMDGIGAGGMAGTQRRVVELSTPFTNSREHADAVETLVPNAYGHLGAEILDRHSAATVAKHLERASDLLAKTGATDFDSPVANEVVKHLVSHVAGASMIDELVGTDGVLTTAAVEAAREYLSEWEEPLHDADRILDAIHDSLFQEPACWPTKAQHEENTQPVSFDPGGSDRSAIARHGVALKTKGLVANDESWIAVFPGVWEELCKELGVDSDVACRELTRRGELIRQGSSHKPGARNYTSVVKVAKKPKRFYKLAFPTIDEDDDTGRPLDPQDDAPRDSGPATDGTSPTEPSLDEAPSKSGEPENAHAEDGQLAFSEPVTGEVTAEQPEVTAEVTAANVPLTSEVTAVTAVTAPSSHVGARTREKDPDPEIVRLDPTGPRPACIVCGAPVGQLVDGLPLHLGPCMDQADRIHQAATDADATSQSSEADTVTQPTAELTNEATTAQQTETAAAPTATATAGGTPATSQQRSGGGRTQRREARFTAPAAVLDEQGIHLADGTAKPFPQISHIGDLAALTGRDQLRLGWGGGEDRLPDQGQIWLTAGALERLGLPVEQPALPDKALTKAQRAKASAKLFARLDDHPMVAGATETGWQLGQGGHLDVWTRIWHPELLPQGALIVGLPWHRIEGVALFEDQPTAGELARRLLLFAQQVGVAYRITSAATGLDLIDYHRPPRRSIDDDRGMSRNRVALIRGTAAELPPWRMKTSDARFTGLEQDFSWWREWDKLPDSEKTLRYVHGYDRNASYLVPWSSIELGVEDLIHRTGEAAAWDGKEKPGYYLIEGGWEWPHWGLPDPATAAGARVGQNRLWVTVHTLKQLKAHGITPTAHESYTWGVTARYLEGPGKALREARTSLTPAAGEDPGAAAVLASVKTLYTGTVGKLAEREHHRDFHLWRPDWRDHVIAATRTAILHTLTKAQALSGASPLVVDRDAVFFASDNPDPVEAWPGDPAKLGPNLGSWKPIGTTTLAEWGPRFLPKRAGRWHYADALEAMTNSEEA